MTATGDAPRAPSGCGSDGAAGTRRSAAARVARVIPRDASLQTKGFEGRGLDAFPAGRQLWAVRRAIDPRNLRFGRAAAGSAGCAPGSTGSRRCGRVAENARWPRRKGQPARSGRRKPRATQQGNINSDLKLWPSRICEALDEHRRDLCDGWAEPGGRRDDRPVGRPGGGARARPVASGRARERRRRRERGVARRGLAAQGSRSRARARRGGERGQVALSRHDEP